MSTTEKRREKVHWYKRTKGAKRWSEEMALLPERARNERLAAMLDR